MEKLELPGRNPLWVSTLALPLVPDRARLEREFHELEPATMFRVSNDGTIFLKTTRRTAVALNTGAVIEGPTNQAEGIFPLPLGSEVLVGQGKPL